MKPDKLAHIISLYFDGRTTLRQERKLYAYFRRSDIDPAFKRYAALFRDMAAADKALCTTVAHRSTLQRFLPRAAAVVLLALLGAGTALLYRQHLYDQLADRYEGSYMIVGGQRTDNLLKIHKQLARTLSEADKTEQRISKLKSAEEAEQEILSSIGDPRIRAAIEQAYNE